MHPDLIKGAREEVGYFPATRRALTSSKLRYEVQSDKLYQDVDSDDNDDNETQSLEKRREKLLLSLEAQNHEDVSKLVERGYKYATELKKEL